MFEFCGRFVSQLASERLPTETPRGQGAHETYVRQISRTRTVCVESVACSLCGRESEVLSCR